MEENKDKDLSVISTYITTVDLEKIPKKKMNYKQYLYNQRIKYGKYCQMGLVNDKVKFRIKDNQLIYEIDNSYSKFKEEEKINNDAFYKALFYCSELDLSIMPSKREIKLRSMLNQKLTRLKELTRGMNNNKK